MPHFDKPILVTGATGHQGGAVTRSLLSEGWPVRAVTRDPAKPASQALAALGAQVVQADLDDPSTLAKPLEGAYGVFSVQNFWEVGKEREIAEGKALADAAKAAGVQHFVYSSVGSAGRQTGLSHFDSKWEIEEHLRGLSLPYTIVRPVFFMDNFLAMQEGIAAGSLTMGLREDKALQMIAVKDIGIFVTMALDAPDQWLYTETDLAGDELTIPQVCRRFSARLDREVSYVEASYEQTAAWSPEYAEMFKWFNDYGYEADLTWLREQHPGLQTFDQWLEQAWPAAAG